MADYLVIIQVRIKGDNAMSFYSGRIRQLLNRCQLRLKEYTATVDAFPDPKDLEFEIETVFDAEVKDFMKIGCTCNIDGCVGHR